MIEVHPNGLSDDENARGTPAARVDGSDWGVERLAWFIHELLSRDLVRLSETGSFVLREDVQRRLHELTEGPPARAPQVFIGRKCETCGLVRLTRLVNGVRTCSECNRPLAAAPEVGEPSRFGVPVP